MSQVTSTHFSLILMGIHEAEFAVVLHLVIVILVDQRVQDLLDVPLLNAGPLLNLALIRHLTNEI